MKWKTIMLALATAAAAVTLVSRPVEALPSNEVTHYYYSTAARTTLVGSHEVTSCYGVVNEMEGVTSPYRTTVSTNCSNENTVIKCYVHSQQVTCPW